MSSSQMATSQATQHQIEGLREEIAIQKTLLLSCKDMEDDREEVEQEIREEIRKLDGQLRALTSSTTTTSTIRKPSYQIPNGSNLNSTLPRNHVGDKSVASSNLSNARSDSGTASSSSAYTSNPLSLHRNATSPSKMALPNRKRTHSKLLDRAPVYGEDNEQVGLDTPDTLDSLSSDEEEMAAFDAEFFKLQEFAVARADQEKLDEEFARALAAHDERTHYSASSQPTSMVSAFDRLNGIRPPASSQQSKNMSFQPSSSGSQTSSKSLKAEFETKYTLPHNPGSASSRIYAPPQYSNQSYGGGTENESSYATDVKHEPHSRMERGVGLTSLSDSQLFKAEIPSSVSMPGSYRDAFSDDDDSDIEIISSSDFRDNGRSNNLSRPLSTAQSSIKRESKHLRSVDSKSMLQSAMYGKKQVPSWLSDTENFTSFQGESSSLYSMEPWMTGSSANLKQGTDAQFGNSMNGLNDMRSMPGAFPGNGLYDLDMDLGYTMNNFSTYGSIKAEAEPSYNSLTDILRRATGMNEDATMIGGSQWDARMLDQASHIVNDPRKTNQEIQDLLENIRPDEDLPPEDREGTPEGLVYPLYEHQKLALAWMKSMEDGSNKGGILADDMGLGKTISALALMLTRPSTERARKTTLIVGPVALCQQWMREIKTKVKIGYRLTTHMVHGQNKREGWDDLSLYDVVLTTYGTIGAEFRRWVLYTERKKLASDKVDVEDKSLRKLFPLLGPKSRFHRVILDEAQCIKNKATSAAKACCQIKSMYRFCLTGTPMMNNVGELYSLIHFLRIKPYNEWTRFRDQFGMLTRGDATKRDVQGAMRKLQALLKAILLRRVKTSLIDGKPIINLPPKTEEIQHVVFSDDEQAFYKALESKTQLQFNKYMKAGTVGKNYSNVLVLLLRLRQACCHPHLIHDFEEAAPAGASVSLEAMIELAKGLAPEVVARILESGDNFEALRHRQETQLFPRC